MATPFTPGPWTYEGDHTHRQFNIRQLGHLIGVSDQAKHICTVNNLPKHVLENRDAGTAEANARAIAEVPAMVEALREALPYLSGTESFAATEAKIRAILARIDGEA